MQNGSREQIKIESSYKNDLVCLLCLTVFVVSIFAGTIFSGKDISRIGTIAHRDTIFGRLAKGMPDPMDTCTYQEHAPNYLLTERIIGSGNLPLWNPYLGFGCPLWADSQVLAFSPLTWLQAPFASLRLYNLMMVFHVWLGCIAAYLLSRLLRISPPGSLLAGMSYGICPNILYMFEWNRCQSAFFPMPFLGFALLWRRSAPRSIVVCAVLCAAMVVSGHAVPSFFAISLSSLMYFILCVCVPNENVKTQLPGDFFRIIRNFSLVGILTFLFSAPFLVPFLEGVRSSDTFKATQGYVRYIVRSTAILPSLFFPFHGPGSVYAGAVSIILAAGAPFISKNNRKLSICFLVLALLTIGILTRPWPFDLLFQLPYLSWFMVVYALPALLLFIAVLAGIGWDSLVEEEKRIRNALLIFAAAILCALMPAIFESLHLAPRFMKLNDWLTVMESSSSVRIRELILLSLSIGIVFVLAKCPAALRSKLAISLIIVNAVSLSFIIRNSLPARPAFSYEAIEPISFLSSQQQRVISMGRHVLVPNTGQIFSVANLLSFMPTHPKGVPAFLEATGISLEGVGQYAEKPLTKLIDVGSVQYAVASEPVLSERDNLPEPNAIGKNGGIDFGEKINLSAVGLAVDAANRDIIGQLSWKLGRENEPAFYMLMLVRPDGSLLWMGDRHRVENDGDTAAFTASIPLSVKTNEDVCLILQVVDKTGTGFLAPIDVPQEMRFPPNSKSLLLKRFTVPEKEVETGRHFRLVTETTPEMVRVYENKTCLPQAYLVTSSRQVASVKEALQEMLKAGFDPRNEALTESEDPIGDSDASGFFELKVRRPNENEVIVEAEPRKPSLLVLTDVFFPGWKVSVDGRESKIFRTNGVFRGVRLDAGHHTVRFFFDPDSLKVGFLLFVLGLITIGFLLRTVKPSAGKDTEVNPGLSGK